MRKNRGYYRRKEKSTEKNKPEQVISKPELPKLNTENTPRKIFSQDDVLISPQPQFQLSKGYYVIRKSWNDRDSEIGKYRNLSDAIGKCRMDYNIYNPDGDRVY